MRRAVFSPQARRDLAKAWEDIVENNPKAAINFIENVERAVELLREFPYTGHTRTDVADKRFRFRVIRPYVLAYRFTSRTLTITRVIHGARDFRRFFR